MATQIALYAMMYVGLFFSVVAILAFLQKRDGLRDYPTPSTFPSVSIIVPAWNEEEYIRDTIRSLQELDYPEDKREIIVVNDGSTDRTSEEARSTGVEVIDKENGGKASALNRGVEEAEGEIVACMDADSIVEKNALKKMVGYFDDPEMGAVTSSMKVENKDDSLLAKMQYAEYIFFIFIRKLLCVLDCLIVIPGPFSLYRKDLVKEVGGFDNCNHVEDMDITFKIHRAGYKIENTLDAEVRTHCPSTLRGLYNQRMRWSRGLIGTIMKYRDMLMDRRFGNFGMFLLPISAASIVLTFLVFASMLVNIGESMFTAIWNAYLVGFDVSYILSAVPTSISILHFSVNTIAMAFGLAMGGSILYLSYNYSREEVRDSATGAIGYLSIYPILLTTFWTLAFIYELSGTEKKWLHR